jgi:two-component system response regulator AgrA
LTQSHFAIIKRDRIEKIKLDDILYFESEGRKVHVYTKERKVSFNGSIDQIRKKLDDRFLCCHGSYAINLTKIERFDRCTVKMEGGALLPVSQKRSTEIRNNYKAYLIKHFPCNLEDGIV